MGYGPVIDCLIESGTVTPDAIAALQPPEGQSLEQALLASNRVTPTELLAAATRVHGIKAAFLKDELIEDDARTLIPQDMITNCQMLPLRREGARVVLAMVDPSDVVAEDFARFVTGFEIERIAIFGFDLQTYLRGGDSGGPSGHEISEEELLSLPVVPDIDSGREEKFNETTPGPVIRAVQAVLSEGVQQKASDIHFEPNGRGLRVRYRIDGYLREVAELPQIIQQMVLTRLKLSAGLDITERRRPQDGRTRLQIGEKSVDFRVSTLPTYYGEKVVMRILDNRKGRVDINDAGMLEPDFRTFLDFVRMPLGMVLITGPTGSGKTTTLYGALTRIHTPDVNIVTVEDPVEYQISGINQVQVNPKAGLTFASALRAILRQDPDVVMVGEIRDLETASIAFESAMTGHLVFSTLHTNDAPSAITRLLHLGVARFLVTSSLLGVVAQRLVRRICPNCRVEVALSPERRQILLRSGIRRIPERFFEGHGCNQCARTGYSGRTGLYEILRVTDAMRDLIFTDASEQEIRTLARAQGTHILLEDGLIKCEMGLTTIQEVLHVAPAGLEAGIADAQAAVPIDDIGSTAASITSKPAPSQPPQLPRRRERALVVDANPDDLHAARAALEAGFFDVITATTAREGLVQVIEQRPDLVIVDMDIPDLDGLQFVRKLRARGLTEMIPVIVTSSRDAFEEESRIFEAGADDYLSKPLEQTRLLHRAEAHLRRVRERATTLR